MYPMVVAGAKCLAQFRSGFAQRHEGIELSHFFKELEQIGLGHGLGVGGGAIRAGL